MSALILSSPINATTINVSKIAPAISHLRMECPRLRSRFHVNQIDVNKFNGWPTVTQLRIQPPWPLCTDSARQRRAVWLRSNEVVAMAYRYECVDPSIRPAPYREKQETESALGANMRSSLGPHGSQATRPHRQLHGGHSLNDHELMTGRRHSPAVPY